MLVDSGPHVLDVDVRKPVGVAAYFGRDGEFALTVQVADVDREPEAGGIDILRRQVAEQSVVAGERIDEHARLWLEGEIYALLVGVGQHAVVPSDNRANASASPAPSCTMPDHRETQSASKRTAMSMRGRENRPGGHGRSDQR